MLRGPAILLLWLGLVLGVGAAPPFNHVARADFAEGLAAYDAGDFATAAQSWQNLAEQGDAEAQVALAGLFADGLGVPRDLAKAARWYRAAAEQGDVVAQLNLADLYRRGSGVEPDRVQAFVWFSLAAEQGHGWAKAQRDALAERLSADELAEANRLLAAQRKTP